jgi:hypothetical protein
MPRLHDSAMDIDDLETETLRCLFAAAETTDLVKAHELRSRALRLNRVAESFEWEGPFVLGSQRSAPNPFVSMPESGQGLRRSAHGRS